MTERSQQLIPQRRIDLYYGPVPVRGDTPEMQQDIENETEFCAIFADDLPADIHNKTTDILLDKYGVHSQFSKEHSYSSYIRPRLVNTNTGLATAALHITQDIDANVLRGTAIRVGMISFNEDIANLVIDEFIKLGYQINKCYD